MSDVTGDRPAEAEVGPHRIIGTPPPAQARTLLSSSSPGDPAAAAAAAPAPRELPADPENLARAKAAERVVAACFLLAMLAGFAMIAAYVFLPAHTVSDVTRSNLALGTSLGLALLLLGIGAVVWVRHLMPDVEIAENRHPLRSDPGDRAAFAKTFTEGAEASQFVKRPILRRSLIAATLPLGLAPVVLLRDMGPLPGTSLRHTVWRKGTRLVEYVSNRPVTPGDILPGSLIAVVPDGYQDNYDALAKAAAILIKFGPAEQLSFTAGNSPVPGKIVQNWTVDNVVAYSKICTHVGCPVALYEQTTHHILCPCHQSTFDATRGAEVIFGPATRPLPQLPMTVDAAGYLVASGDFTEPVGPSFWERG